MLLCIFKFQQMEFVTYAFLRFIILLFSITPFWLLYLVSDGIYGIIYYVAPYRKKVVLDNLAHAFPEKTTQEIIIISKHFYHFLADLLVEGLKGMTMNETKIRKRHKIINPELLDEFVEQKKSVIGLTGHYGNWEWGAFSSGVQIKHPIIAFYKPIKNKYIDNYIKAQRAKYNCKLASIKETYGTFEKYHNKTVAFVMVADQSPTNLDDCFWLDFLNQGTPCLHGPEKYARMHNLPVVYIDIRKIKRGFYELELVIISDNPNDLKEGELTAIYFKMLEGRINNEPANWLWSHKRWKHKRSEKLEN